MTPRIRRFGRQSYYKCRRLQRHRRDDRDSGSQEAERCGDGDGVGIVYICRLKQWSFHIIGPNGANPNFLFRSKGTVEALALTGNGYPSPTTRVLTGIGDISADSCLFRVNGTQVAAGAEDQGSGNYGNYILYIGRRGGSSLPFNGDLYQLIIRGKTTPTGKLLEAERFVSKKTGVNL